jgi:hypothetical protein
MKTRLIDGGLPENKVWGEYLIMEKLTEDSENYFIEDLQNFLYVPNVLTLGDKIKEVM